MKLQISITVFLLAFSACVVFSRDGLKDCLCHYQNLCATACASNYLGLARSSDWRYKTFDRSTNFIGDYALGQCGARSGVVYQQVYSVSSGATTSLFRALCDVCTNGWNDCASDRFLSVKVFDAGSNYWCQLDSKLAWSNGYWYATESPSASRVLACSSGFVRTQSVALTSFLLGCGSVAIQLNGDTFPNYPFNCNPSAGGHVRLGGAISGLPRCSFSMTNYNVATGIGLWLKSVEWFVY